jgi:hypothetical protein
MAVVSIKKRHKECIIGNYESILPVEMKSLGSGCLSNKRGEERVCSENMIGLKE